MTEQTKAAGGGPAAMGIESSAGSAYSRAYCSAGAGQSQKPVLVFDGRGRHVGSVHGRELRITAHGKRHMLKVAPGPGWALNVDVFRRAEELGADRVTITDADDNRRTYTATLADFRAKGIGFDLGWGRQVCLRLADWQTSAPPKVTQLALFEVAGL